MSQFKIGEKTNTDVVLLYLHDVADQIGSIEVGKDADITIYSDHPVKSYAAHVQFCMINGKVVLS